MGKVTEIKFVGQPIFKQVVGLIDAISIHGLIKKHDADPYFKAFKAKTHPITVLFGILSQCGSMRRNHLSQHIRRAGVVNRQRK